MRMNFGGSYAVNAFTFGARVRWIDELDAINASLGSATGSADGDNFIGYDKVNSHTETDVFMQYMATEGIELTLGANNIFDVDPPYVYSTGNNTDPALYGTAIPGVTYYMNAAFKF